MSSNAQQDYKVETQPESRVDAEGIQSSEQLESENISEHMKSLLGVVGHWFSDLSELLSAEARLAVASVNRLFLLSILFSQAIVIFVVFAFVLVGLALNEMFGLGALELSGIGLAAAGLMVLILRNLMRSIRKNLLPVASIEQIQVGLSDLISSLESKPQDAVNKPEFNNEKTED